MISKIKHGMPLYQTFEYKTINTKEKGSITKTNRKSQWKKAKRAMEENHRKRTRATISFKRKTSKITKKMMMIHKFKSTSIIFANQMFMLGMRS